jgi:hypothetical protein
MALNRQKQFTIKNGEWAGSTIAHQSGFTGGMPARINSAGEIARAYNDDGYVGVYALGSDVVNSGDPVTYYTSPGIFTLEKNAAEAAYPYDEALTYTPGDNIGILNGEWVNSGHSTTRARVLAVGTVAGGNTQSLTIQML